MCVRRARTLLWTLKSKETDTIKKNDGDMPERVQSVAVAVETPCWSYSIFSAPPFNSVI